MRTSAMMRSNLRFAAIVLASALGVNSGARADFVVTVGSTTIAQGGSGTVDVLIRSTNGGGDALASFGFELLITPSGTRHLDFRAPQLDAQLALGTYVFAGNSADATDEVAVGNVRSFSGGTNNQFIGGDSTNNGGNVTVTANTLLLRLDLTGATSAAPLTGDSFNVSLIPSAFTDFRDTNNKPIAFTSTSGVVQITAVPEPSSSVLLTVGCVMTLSVGYIARLMTFSTLKIKLKRSLLTCV